MGLPELFGNNDNLEAEEGLTAKTPVMISATTSLVGVPAEYAWLQQRFGRRDKEWTVDIRSRGTDELGRTIETFRLTLRDGSKVDVHFDVTSFYQS